VNCFLIVLNSGPGYAPGPVFCWFAFARVGFQGGVNGPTRWQILFQRWRIVKIDDKLSMSIRAKIKLVNITVSIVEDNATLCGYPYKEIAEALHVSIPTVNRRIRRIHEKLRVRLPSQAIGKFTHIPSTAIAE
jgi:hypothetical protein